MIINENCILVGDAPGLTFIEQGIMEESLRSQHRFSPFTVVTEHKARHCNGRGPIQESPGPISGAGNFCGRVISCISEGTLYICSPLVVVGISVYSVGV